MTEDNRNDDAEDADEMGGDEGGTTGAAGADNITPQGEVSGDDPAGFEVSGAGDEGGQGGGSEPSGGVGDWDPASAGGGGGELY